MATKGPKHTTAPTKKKKMAASGKSGFIPAWPFSDRQTFYLCAGLVLILTGIVYAPYLFGARLFIFNDAGADPLTLFYPNLVHAARYFQEEGFPGWSFYIGLGSNYYPGFVNSPLQWPFLLMGPKTIAYAIGWVQAAVMAGTGLVFYRFLKEALMVPVVRIAGTLAYTFGGYLVIGSTWYTHAHSIFWMTCAILGFELILRKKAWWVFPLPFLMLLGTRAYFLVLFFAIFAAIRFLDEYGFSFRLFWKGYKRLFIAGIVAISLALPFIGGEWHRFAYSPRVAGNVSYSENLSSRPVLHVSDQEHFLTALYRTFSNDGLGHAANFKGWKNYLEAPAFYMGLLTLLMLFQFFALVPLRKKLLYGGFLLFWVLLIIFPWFRFAFYGFAGNYYKAALSLFIPLSFLFVALMGFNELMKGKRIHLPVWIFSWLVLMVLLWFPYDEPEVAISAEVQMKATIFLAGYMVLGLAWWMQTGRNILLPAIVLLIAIEAVVFSWPALNERSTLLKADLDNGKHHFDHSMEAAAFIREQDPDQFYRVEKVYGSVKSGFNDGMVQGYAGTKTYQSHNHNNYVRFVTEMEFIDASLEVNTRWMLGVAFINFLHPLFSVKYLLSGTKTDARVDKSIYEPVAHFDSVNVYKNRFFIPFGIPFDRYLAHDQFMKMSAQEKRFALYQAVILDDPAQMSNLESLHLETYQAQGGIVNQKLAELPSSAMKHEIFSHNHMKGTVDLQKPSVVFFSFPFDIGWKAKLDGRHVELWNVNMGLTGLYVPAGSHTIELNYVPPLSNWGWLGWIFAGMIIYLIVRFQQKFWN